MTGETSRIDRKKAPFRHLFSAAAVIWSIVAVTILVVELRDQKNFLTANALSIARASYEKDIAFRRWGAMHGGVYVPVTEKTPPNPYLDVPERDISTPSGQALTRMNPAYMIRQVYEAGRFSADVPEGHITSLKPIRPENAPDPWERKALQRLEKGGLEFSEFQTINGEPHFRYLHVLKAERPCLKCHAAQGYREDDVRGGISVTIPMALLDRSVTTSSYVHTLLISVVWMSGMTGLWFSFRRVSASSLALRESEERYRSQFQQSRAVMLIVNPYSGAIEDANPAACDYYGFSREKMLEQKIYDINCSEAEEVESRLTEVRDGIIKHFKCRHRLSDGCIRDVEVFSSPFFSQGSIHLHSIIFDITDRMAAEQQLHDKMDFAENLIYNSTAPTFVIDADHKVLIWNRSMEDLCGVKASEMIGSSLQWRAFYPSPRPCLADIVVDETAGEAAALYLHFSVSKQVPDRLHAEDDYILGGRKRRLLISSAPIRDHHGKIIAAIETIEDITERLSLEAQLLHSQKMESVGALAGGIAHDFNNVLTVISGYADLLKLTATDDENLHIAHEISASVNRAAEMTRSLLSFSGKHDMMLQHDDLNQILAEVRKSLGRLIREDITLSIQPCGERLPIYVDRVQIEQVLFNLVVNARDAIGSGGEITLSTSSVLFEEASINGGTVILPGLYARLCVSDNGAGIAAGMIDRIFDPFFTTKEKGKGTGLGLSIVHGIVTKHGGYITVTSTPGAGTEFCIYLRKHEADQSVNQVEAIAAVNYHGSETILIVEDDASIMRMFRQLLELYGYSILEAGDGIEALEIFENNREQIRIAIVDVIMPRMNGRELVEELRKRLPELPIIMISGYTDDIVDRAALDELNAMFIQKPVNPLELLSAVRSGLEKGVLQPQLPN